MIKCSIHQKYTIINVYSPKDKVLKHKKQKLEVYHKNKWSKTMITIEELNTAAQSCLTLRSHGLYSPWTEKSMARILECSSLPNQLEPESPTLQAVSLPAEPPGKPKHKRQSWPKE